MIDLSSYAQSLGKKRIAVFGLGMSGLSSVKALVKAGITVTAYDDKPENCDKAKAFGAEIEDLSHADLSVFDFLVLAPGVPYTYNPHAVVQNAQKYNVEIIGDLELLHRANHGVKTIGITGTNGKSTTTALLNHVLNECGKKSLMGGNIGKSVLDLDLNDIEVLVIEVSSYQMDLCPSFRPNISMLLNITPDHLDRHGSMKAYVEAKANILDGDGLGVICTDDDYTMALFDKAFCGDSPRRILPVSVQDEVVESVFVKKNTLYKNHAGENVKITDLQSLETLKGVHNQQNIVCAYAVCKELGLDDDKIINALATYSGLPHRQYIVTTKNNVTYINDSKATNAEAAAKALASYEDIYWIVGGRSKEAGLKGLSIFKDKIKKSYLIGEATEEFSKWFQKYDFNFEAFETLNQATEAAHNDAQKENQGTVLLSPACASWDQFPSFEARGDAFTQKVLSLISEGTS
jgi:UDP-N-acetylmuramoylalanine--D-glutamate ligase